MTRQSGSLKLARRVAIALALVSWAVIAAESVHAADMMVAQTNLVSGSQASDFVLDAPSAGTFTVELADLDFSSKLANLSFSATTASSVLDALDGPTTNAATFTVSGAETVYAHILGQAAGPFDLGLYSLDIAFTPVGSPVPLPSAGWLLLAGLAALGGLGGATSLRTTPALRAAQANG